MLKDGDIVKIKPEWCDSEKEKQNLYIVKNVNEITHNCIISLIDIKRKYALGLSHNVKEEMLILYKKRDELQLEDIPNLIDVNIDKNILQFTLKTNSKKIIYLDSLKYDNSVDDLVKIIELFEHYQSENDNILKKYEDYNAFIKQNKQNKQDDNTTTVITKAYIKECFGKVTQIDVNNRMVCLSKDNWNKWFSFDYIVDTIYASGLYSHGLILYLSNPSKLKPLFKTMKLPYKNVHKELEIYLIKLNKERKG